MGNITTFISTAVFFYLMNQSLVLADYSEHPKSQALVNILVAEHGFNEKEVLDILRLAETEDRILDSMKNAAEKTKTWSEYKTGFLSPLRIKNGAKFLAQHEALFDRVEKEYGVPRTIITAILGVETNYGSYTGKANVLNALATLAFEHPRRSKFFMSELKEYILLSQEKNWQPEKQTGSYAGAMGFSQFMPSNYRRLAVDGDADGEVNLFKTADAVYSIANYFVHHGWQDGGLVTVQATMQDKLDEVLAKELVGKGLKPNKTVKELKNAGFHLTANIDDTVKARIVRFKDAGGDEAWYGFQNFYVISRYNPRAKYAMAVYLLSLSIEQASAIDE